MGKVIQERSAEDKNRMISDFTTRKKRKDLGKLSQLLLNVVSDPLLSRMSKKKISQTKIFLIKPFYFSFKKTTKHT